MKEYSRLYREKNKETENERHRLYREKNKETENERHRLYHIANKEKDNERKRLHYENNKEEGKRRRKVYLQTPEGIRSIHYGNWNTNGVIFISREDRDMIYERYLQSKKCEVCGNKYKSNRDRCLDHDHTITDAPNFRQILCQRCNNKDNWKNHSEWV